MTRANIEIKARCADLGAARERAKAVATEWLGVDRQVDTYFRVPEGRLKLRESSLSGGQLVPYLRPDEAGPRRSDYQVVPVDDPAGLKSLLSAILGVHRVVAKEREIYVAHDARLASGELESLPEEEQLRAQRTHARQEKEMPSRRRIFEGRPLPAVTAMQAAALGLPGLKMEVDVIAVLGE